MADEIVAPGENIKPQIDLAGAVALAERLYGLHLDSATELNGYDDKNYHLKTKSPLSNKCIEELWPHGYVLKIMNSSDSKKLKIVEAQGELMLYLDKNGIQTPIPQRNIDGELYCLVDLQDSGNRSTKHVVRLLTYQNGTLMKDVQWSYELHFTVGRFTAQLDLLLQKFSHSAFRKYSSLWMLKNVSNVQNYLHVLENDEDSSLVEIVINTFEENVLSKFNSLTLGVIHGDIHDQNLLCQRGEDGQWQISAVLDFGDSHHSAYVFELAQTMAYMMLQSKEVESGRHVVAGYTSLHPLASQELQLLRVCVCARLCQSLVLGLYSYTQYPGNEYVLSTQRPGWTLLHTLWAMDSTQLSDLWFSHLNTQENRILIL